MKLLHKHIPTPKEIAEAELREALVAELQAQNSLERAQANVDWQKRRIARLRAYIAEQQ